MALDKGLRAHTVRTLLRTTIWKKLEGSRPSFTGIATGVNTKATNRLWMSCGDEQLAATIRALLIGGIYVSDRWYSTSLQHSQTGHDATTPSCTPESARSQVSSSPDSCPSDDISSTNLSNDASSDHQHDTDSDDPLPVLRSPRRRVCLHCATGAPETMIHVLWDCPAHDTIRADPRFHHLPALRSSWPPCLSTYGIIPCSMGDFAHAEALQRMQATIIHRRDELDRIHFGISAKVPPWETALLQPAAPFHSNVSALPTSPPRWRYGPQLLHALKSWLLALKWTTDGSVSFMELAVDFELYSGLDLLPLPLTATSSTLPLLSRGQLFGRILKALCTTCTTSGLDYPLPGRMVPRVYCLRAVGARSAWGGLTPRPQFACADTSTVASSQFSTANRWTSSRRWGSDLIPDYTAFTDIRRLRSQQWPVIETTSTRSDRPPRPATPSATRYAPTEQQARHVCQTHSKPKCTRCVSTDHNRSLRIEECCQLHHNDDDDLPVQFCLPHRMLRCGHCSTAQKCCSRGHHSSGPPSSDTMPQSTHSRKRERNTLTAPFTDTLPGAKRRSAASRLVPCPSELKFEEATGPRSRVVK